MKPATFTLTSTSFKNQAAIPVKYTGDGKDISPLLRWSEFPTETQSFVLVVDDPDAPTAEPWVHWLVYNIPAVITELTENVSIAKIAEASSSTICEGINSWGKPGYRGPAPPRGHGVHHYHFKVYALNFVPTLKPGSDKKTVLKAVRERIIAEAEIVGTYKR